jgi:hypothetical protein
METNMITQAWHKDHLVDMGVAGGFSFSALRLKTKGWPCVYVLNIAAVENTVEVHRQLT